MSEKKDWELVLKNNKEEKEKLIKQMNRALPQIEALIALAEQKIKEFPEEKDEMPVELKDTLKEISNA